MSKFFMGLALCLLGLIAWAIFSVIFAVGDFANGQKEIPAWQTGVVTVFFLIAVLSPILFWFVLPILGLLRRFMARRARARTHNYDLTP